MKEIVDGVADVAVEGVELRKTLRLQFGVWEKGLEQAGGQWGVDSVEQFHEQQADAIASGEETITAGVREFFHETFGSQFEQVVAEGRETVLLGGAAQSLGGLRMELGGSESIAGGDVGEA